MAGKKLFVIIFSSILFALLNLFTLCMLIDKTCYYYVYTRIESIATNPDAMMYSHSSQYIERNKPAYYQIYNMGGGAVRYLDTIMKRDSDGDHHGLRYYIADEIRRDIIERRDFFK